jgi:hypothetical protein
MRRHRERRMARTLHLFFAAVLLVLVLAALAGTQCQRRTPPRPLPTSPKEALPC